MRVLTNGAVVIAVGLSIGLGFASSAAADTRVAFQGRIDAANLFLVGNTEDSVNLVPLITPGVRFDRLFVGLGFGFFGVEDETSGFSFSPMGMFDFYRTEDAAVYGVGWLNIGNFDDDRAMGDDDQLAWGFAFAAGLRALVSDAFAVGAELGWGFLFLERPVPVDDDETAFSHSVVGNVFLEASIGL
ncbi:MAG: hypothetical protein AAGF12_08400 [Myxococcota bacterium]